MNTVVAIEKESRRKGQLEIDMSGVETDPQEQQGIILEPSLQKQLRCEFNESMDACCRFKFYLINPGILSGRGLQLRSLCI